MVEWFGKIKQLRPRAMAGKGIMKFYGHAEDTAKRIVEGFELGNIPKAISQVFINWDDGKPCRNWSWSNQIIVALAGTCDARGMKQWNKVGRSVRKGTRACHILVPVHVKNEDKETGEEGRPFLVGFKTAPVFRYEDTKGKELEDGKRAQQFVDSLPLIDVARSWGLDVGIFNGQGAGYLGKYSHAGAIAIGTENLSTWAHELIHAADHKVQGELKGGQQLDQEVVAEFGGSILLQCIGMNKESDIGGCWEYIQSHSKEHGKNTIGTIMKFLNRTCKAVELVMSEAKLIETKAAA